MSALRGIVLAAGTGRRMGGPKVLLTLDGHPLIRLHVARLLEVGCASVTIVVRPEAEGRVRDLLSAFVRPAVELVAVCTEAQSESLDAALRHMHCARTDTLIVTPIDLLPAEVTTHRVLQAALGVTIVAATPMHAGRGGHPVVVRRAALEPSELPPLRTLLRALGPARVRIAVADEKILGDFDRPRDLRPRRPARGWASRIKCVVEGVGE